MYIYLYTFLYLNSFTREIALCYCARSVVAAAAAAPPSQHCMHNLVDLNFVLNESDYLTATMTVKFICTSSQEAAHMFAATTD